MRRPLELDPDRRRALRHPLAGPQEEGHARPAPVVDLEPERDEGLGSRFRIDRLLLAIAGDLLAQHPARAVLAADRTAVHLLAGQRADRLQHLHLLVSDRALIEADRWLHGHQCQQLQLVVLDDVAERAGALVIASAAFNSQFLGDRDLDRVHVLVVPDRLEDGVGEAEGEDVLNGLLAQVVVDPEDLVLVEDGLHLGVQRSSGLQVGPERLLDHDPPPGPLRRFGHRGRAQVRHDQRERRRRRGAVIDPVAAGVPLLVDLVQEPVQALEARAVSEVQLLEAHAVQEGFQDRLVDRLGARVGADGVGGALAELLVAQVALGRADHPEARRQDALQGQVVNRRQQLALRQVAGRAEDDDQRRVGDPVLVQALAEGIGLQLGRFSHARRGAPRGRRTACASSPPPGPRRSWCHGCGSARKGSA